MTKFEKNLKDNKFATVKYASKNAILNMILYFLTIYMIIFSRLLRFNVSIELILKDNLAWITTVVVALVLIQFRLDFQWMNNRLGTYAIIRDIKRNKEEKTGFKEYAMLTRSFITVIEKKLDLYKHFSVVPLLFNALNIYVNFKSKVNINELFDMNLDLVDYTLIITLVLTILYIFMLKVIYGVYQGYIIDLNHYETEEMKYQAILKSDTTK